MTDGIHIAGNEIRGIRSIQVEEQTDSLFFKRIFVVKDNTFRSSDEKDQPRSEDPVD